jgi:membrane protease YdiL (CAAX protease family)
VPVCSVHPQAEASRACEYCVQPHCSECLRPLLGRVYCPTCYLRVAGVARQPVPQPAVAAAASARPSRPGEPLSALRPALPGWLSALIYFIGFIAVTSMSQLVLALPLIVAKLRVDRFGLRSGGAAPRELFDATAWLDASGIGVPLWVLLMAVITWGGFLVTLGYTALLSQQIEKRRVWSFGLKWESTGWRDLFAGILLASVLFISIVGTGAARNWYTFRSVVPAVDALVIAVVGFLVLLPAAATEELSIRGYLMQTLERQWGKPAAIGLSSVAFAFLHAMNPSMLKYPLASVGLILAGLYLASAYYLTRNLWLAIFLHTGWNLLVGPVFGLPVSGIEAPASILRTQAIGPSLWTGGEFGPLWAARWVLTGRKSVAVPA